MLRSGVVPRELIPRAPQTREKKEMEARKARLEYARIQKAKASLDEIKRQRLAEGLAKAEKRAKEDKVRSGSAVRKDAPTLRVMSSPVCDETIGRWYPRFKCNPRLARALTASDLSRLVILYRVR